MQREEYDMEMLKLRLQMLRELWQKLLRQGMLVTTLFLISAALAYAVIWLHKNCQSEMKAMRLEYKAELADARDESRKCEAARIEENADTRQQIKSLRELVERQMRRR